VEAGLYNLPFSFPAWKCQDLETSMRGTRTISVDSLHSRPCEQRSPMSEGITGAQCRNALATPSPVCTGTRSRSDKVICSIHRFGQLTWSSPGGGPRARAQGPDREHGGSRGREGCFPPRAETVASAGRRPSPHLHLGQSLTPLVTRLLGRHSGGGRDERLT